MENGDNYDELFIAIDKLDTFGQKIINNKASIVKLNNQTVLKELTTDNQIILPDNTENFGRCLYNKYQQLRDLSTVMEHPEFFNFYLKYLRKPDEFKRMLVLMKLYHMISKYMFENDPTEDKHNAYHKLVMLYKLINNPIYYRILTKKILKMDSHQRFLTAN